MSKPIVRVAIGLLFSHACVLVGFRQAHQHQGNKYEFPGGKIDLHERPEDACRREIKEEVGVEISDWLPWDYMQHEYDDVIVQLHFFYTYIDDTLRSQIQSPWFWCERERLSEFKFPKANQAVIKRLQWPPLIQISADLNAMTYLPPNHLFYYRPNHTDDVNMKAIDVTHYSKLMINWAYAIQLLPEAQKQLAAIHIRQNQLYTLKREDLLMGAKYIAACHDLKAVQFAQDLGCEAVLISPVQATATHPDAKPIGFDGLATIAAKSHLLVYGLGGLKAKDLTQIKQCQAYGVAGISGFTH